MATAGAIGIAAAAIALAPAIASAQTPPQPAQPAPYGQPAPYAPYAQPAPYGQPAPYAQPAPYGQPAQYPYPQPYPPQVVYVPAQPAAPEGPRKITDWEEGEPIPAGYHKVSHVRVGLIVGGAVTFGLTYLTTALAGALVSDIGSVTSCGMSCSSAKPLLVPVAGPFIVLPHSDSAMGSFFLVFDGVLQIGGLAMLIAGIAAPKVDLVRDGTAQVHVVPTPVVFDNKGAGFGFRGTF